MIIPYQYNKMAAGAKVSDPNRAIAGSRGVFTYLRNGSCNQSGMVMENRFLASSKISRMEVYYAGTALYTTVGSYAHIAVQSGGIVTSTVVNYGGYIEVSSGGSALETELNSSGSMYLYPGASASGGEAHSYGRIYGSSNTVVDGFHLSYGAGLYGQGTSVTFRNIVVSSGADFNAGSSSGVQVLHTTVTSGASLVCGSLLLLVADTVARTIIAPHILPVAVLTAFLGAPIFIYIIIKGRRI